MSRIFAVVFVACAVNIAAQTQKLAPVEAGWTSLFNGVDFTGWKISGSQTTFTIQDGAMVANGRVAHAFSDGPFRDPACREVEL